MSKFPYKVLDQYVLRTPSKSFHLLKTLFKGKDINEQQFKDLTTDPLFQEALFLASPLLYSTLLKWLKEGLNTEKEEKLKISLLKYISRMSSRCTPFGLFAGYSLGQLGDYNEVEINEESKYLRYTRLDMQYLITFSQYISVDKKLRNHFIYQVNSSVYKAGSQYRYVEYTYPGGLQRVHHIQAIETTPHLEYIFDKASTGSTIVTLTEELIQYDPEIDRKEAKRFINELIDNQVLVSNISGSSIGEDYFTSIKNNISPIKNNFYNESFNQISNELSELDKKIPNTISSYYTLKSKIDELGVKTDPKFLFQTDLSVTTKKNILDKKIIRDLQDGLHILNGISFISEKKDNLLLDNFISKFKKKYEDREIPLPIALDNEIGIGYGINTNIIPGNHFLENLHIPIQRKNKNEIKWNAASTLFQDRIMEALRNNCKVITLTAADVPENTDGIWDDIHDTFSLMTEIIHTDNEQKIFFHGFSGASGANLFGRFCSSDSSLKEHTQNIIDIEKEIRKNFIIAEISHIPEARIGNVICRPSFVDYEIPYLSMSEKTSEFQIKPSDLMVSVRNNKILLRSKKLNKYIIPRLNTAHNFSNNSLPVYHFLCDLQSQDSRYGLGLNLGSMEKRYKYIPRIEYKKCILKAATWNLNKKDMPIFTKKYSSDEDLFDLMNETQKQWDLPQYVLFAEHDNDLLINLENIYCIKMLIDTIGNRENFTLKEFLYTDDNQLVRRNGRNFTNQFVFTFYNNQKLSAIKNAK
ncbi:lantibiotic dehydratase family protein [Chryseobacterium sp. OSA05B]|uniref:lantibiotic dehydratase family protein n=1 Tax=Chryseobacterium sp. OSA05B TaxID=2862650 RepID=UPI001CBDA6C0|nr:lantibiotic dehydratase family protein [Chryseobacterium sp. OSA05B]